MPGFQFVDETVTTERPEDEAQIVPGETWLRGPADDLKSKVTATDLNRLKAIINNLVGHYGSSSDGDDMLLNAVKNAAEPYSYVSEIGPPTTSDDGANSSGRGVFVLGSKWYDKTNNEVYRCLSDATSEALWAKTSLTIDELGNAATLNAGTSANELLQLDGTGKIPAVDGSQLTNLPATSLSNNSIEAAHITAGAITTNKIVDAAITAAKLGSDVAQILQFKTFEDETDYSRTGNTYSSMGPLFEVEPKSPTSSLVIFWTIHAGVTESSSNDDLGFYVWPHYYRGSDTTYYGTGHVMSQIVTNLDGSSAHSSRNGSATLSFLGPGADFKDNGDWKFKLHGRELYAGTGYIYEQRAVAIEVEL